MQVIPAITISDGLPTIALPLMFVIMVSMLKDFVENCKRINSDNQENNSPVLAFKNGKFEPTFWKKLLTGDIIKLQRGDYIPADLLLVYSTSEKADCFVETKNLDGETNLKMKTVHPCFREKVTSESDLPNIFQIRLQYEEPNPFLYSFDGYMTADNETFPIETKHVLLRGSNLRNTQAIYGVVVFTGHCTKIMMNSVKAKPKRSHLEVKLGWQILTVFLLLVVYWLRQVAFCSIAAALYLSWVSKYSNQVPYLKIGSYNGVLEFFIRLGNWILIFG